MKIALCFLISYAHKIHHEELWKEWINAMPDDSIRVYIHYTDYSKISSEWIKRHVIPQKYIANTSYASVVSAYLNTMMYALKTDEKIQWFCMLTETCVPIMDPHQFLAYFTENKDYTIMSWRHAYWNVYFHRRANLHLLPTDFHLSNDPWFIIKREHVLLFYSYLKNQPYWFYKICQGIIANESIFAIILKYYNQLDDRHVINRITHIADWSRMTSPTSPYVFKDSSVINNTIIHKLLKENIYACFMRKVDEHFPQNELVKIAKEREKNISLKQKI
jgi:hypothetical protein